jgi:4-hydroxyphenylpyruvate dioxygenase
VPPTVLEDELGHMIKAAIQTFGDTVHSFVECESYDPGAFAPLYQSSPSPGPAGANGLVAIDHAAVGVEAGELGHWVRF